MHEYRVTKYNPEFRDERGTYLKEDWIMAGEVGQSFAGVVLTVGEYQRVENAYVEAAVEFLREANVDSLTVQGLSNRSALLALSNGSTIGLVKTQDLIRGMLQEKFWCRLEGKDAFVHIGWDYYMYIGVTHRCIMAERKANELGLYVEECVSPYHEELED